MTLQAYPVYFPDQMRQHLRSLRRSRGLTQAELGLLLGVSQARIAEIESRPGVVSVEQLMKLLSALGVTLMLQEDISNLPSYEGLKHRGKSGQKKSTSTPRMPDIPAYASIVQTNAAPQGIFGQPGWPKNSIDTPGTGTGASDNGAFTSSPTWTPPITSCDIGNVFNISTNQKASDKASQRKLPIIPPRKGSW